MDSTRISKLRDYLFDVINELINNNNSSYQINADFLGDVGDFSLDKIPTSSEVERWIDGTEIHRDTYSFRSRKTYGKNALNNLKNIGFFEAFEQKIKSNNKKGIWPDIANVQSVECLNSGTLNGVDGTRATFNIQIQITYIDDGTGGVSL